MLADKGFFCKRSFGKIISPFSKIIEKRGWESFCAHMMSQKLIEFLVHFSDFSYNIIAYFYA